MSTERLDFFISHAGADRAWAEWVAWQLDEAGYSVELALWDWAVGENFVTRMGAALQRAAAGSAGRPTPAAPSTRR